MSSQIGTAGVAHNPSDIKQKQIQDINRKKLISRTTTELARNSALYTQNDVVNISITHDHHFS